MKEYQNLGINLKEILYLITAQNNKMKEVQELLKLLEELDENE